jgi:hypothetical protein
MSEWQNKRLELKYRDNGLRTVSRFTTDEQLREWDRHVDSTPLSPEQKAAAKRALRRFQSLPDEEAMSGLDPSIVEALRRLAEEVA